jgi:Preprotein translocase subunit SecB
MESITSSNTSANSVLQMEQIIFDEITFKCDRNLPQSGVFKINYTREVGQAEDDSTRFIVALRVNIESEVPGLIDIHVRACGFFNCSETDEAKKNVLVTKNTVAILFPFLRSQVSLLTTQPGFAPIMLPVVNINEMFEDESVEKTTPA